VPSKVAKETTVGSGPGCEDEAGAGAAARQNRAGAGLAQTNDVKAIRKQVKMSPAEFSRAYRISQRALEEWEQGGRQPDSAARAYLTVIANESAAVRRALAKGWRDRGLAS
jgi:DNA-binding transcriptional regulator YiaG